MALNSFIMAFGKENVTLFNPQIWRKPMTKKLIEIASEIVQNQVSSTPMSAVEITSSLRQVFSTLHELQKAETAGIDIEFAQPAPEEVAATKLSPADSIQNDKVICLECGAEMRQLTTKHLVSHGMNQNEYRKKYGFSMRTPLAAKSLTKARSKAAKKRGLPEKLQKYIEARRQAKAKASIKAATKTETASKPKQTRLRKKKA
jgi:predicted transcriptional regulator